VLKPNFGITPGGHSARPLTSKRHRPDCAIEALGTSQKSEIAKWWAMLKSANIKVD
jgi:hypothetical protein